MRLDEFDYTFPERLIATTPHEPRDESRLLVVDRKTGALSHQRFLDLPTLLAPTDLLVFNDTKVFPARLFAKKPTGGAVELLLVRKHDDTHFTAMIRSSKGVRDGTELHIADGFSAVVLAHGTDHGGFVEVELRAQSVPAALAEHGHIPLPPYMQRADTVADRTMYQTMFAQHEGSAAAPTAGLHFTPRVLNALQARGIQSTRITLHVGPGTFMPVREDAADDVRKHIMHHELYSVNEQAAQALQQRQGRVVAVGTTSVRTLESVAHQHGGSLRASSGDTNLFILPGFEFMAVDAMLTNFHQPKSTLLMLISAFAGLELVRHVYAEAIRHEYRLFSYGDACLFL